MPTLINKTVNEAVDSILTGFNAVVSDSSVQTFFAARLPSWGLCRFIFGSDDPQYEIEQVKAVTQIYSLHIQAAIVVSGQTTHKTTVTRNYGKTSTITHDTNDTTTVVDGGEKTSDMQYPTGYTGATDKSYLNAEQIRESLNNDITTIKRGGDDRTVEGGKDVDITDEISVPDYITALNATNLSQIIDDIIYHIIDPVLCDERERCDEWQ